MTFADVVRTHTVRLTCDACPTQYEGLLLDGRHFYFRYRHGIAALGIGASLDEAVMETIRGEAPAIVHGDRLDGFVSEEEFRELFVRLLGLRGAPCT